MLDRDALKGVLSRHPARTIALAGLRPAAVLVPLYLRDGADHLLFTRRSELMNHHRGEIAFPGGVRHASDADLLQTALRETAEETGIRSADVCVLGRLDDVVSVHGYRVSPYVGTFPHPYPLRPNRGEVAEVIEVPLAALEDPGAWRTEDWRHRGRPQPVHFCTVGAHEIWGLTAAVVRQFLRRVREVR